MFKSFHCKSCDNFGNCSIKGHEVADVTFFCIYCNAAFEDKLLHVKTQGHRLSQEIYIRKKVSAAWKKYNYEYMDDLNIYSVVNTLAFVECKACNEDVIGFTPNIQKHCSSFDHQNKTFSMLNCWIKHGGQSEDIIRLESGQYFCNACMLEALLEDEEQIISHLVLHTKSIEPESKKQKTLDELLDELY